jgi:hypothetical protein
MGRTTAAKNFGIFTANESHLSVKRPVEKSPQRRKSMPTRFAFNNFCGKRDEQPRQMPRGSSPQRLKKRRFRYWSKHSAIDGMLAGVSEGTTLKNGYATELV